ncbi:phosphotransferase enzyme family protein [Nemania sp. FL0031]|nr:phosphotransferase enzyme family protein [Nemania sp. FL0031]
MDWDELAEQQSQRIFAGWLQLLFRESPALLVKIAGRYRPNACVTEVSHFTTSSCNICCIVTLDNGERLLVRFPILGRSRFRTEKTKDELLVMRFLTQHTQVPVPSIVGDHHWAGGPYIVMSVIEGILMSKCLGDRTVQSPNSDPTVSNSNLERAYHGMAQVMIELSKPTFSSIGALGWDSEWKVVKRPLTLNMNELVRVGDYPPTAFAEHTFQTASEYFQELATQQFLYLRFQRSNAVDDEVDCRKKYIARCLFRRIARQIQTEPGPFHLYCDDFRPSNFTYVAPSEFTYTASWWLLFESPEAWESDLNKFLDRYRPRLQLFLKVLRAYEDEQVQNGAPLETQRLSSRMARSMETGLFWFCLAARKGFIFDDIYWAFLDKEYFGHLNSLGDRLSLLTQDEQNELDGFVQGKVQQANEKTLPEHLSVDQVVERF